MYEHLNLIGKDDTIKSKCINCERCCISDNVIPLNSFDLLNLKKVVGGTINDILSKYCSYDVLTDTQLPTVTLRKTDRCPFEENGLCTLGKNKPDYCQVRPFRRTIDRSLGEQLFYVVPTNCLSSNATSITTIGNIADKDNEEYGLGLDEWYYQTTKSRNYKELVSDMNDETKELIELIVLHILYRSLDEFDTSDVTNTIFELRYRYIKLNDLINEIESIRRPYNPLYDGIIKSNVVNFFEDNKPIYQLNKNHLDNLILKYVNTPITQTFLGQKPKSQYPDQRAIRSRIANSTVPKRIDTSKILEKTIAFFNK